MSDGPEEWKEQTPGVAVTLSRGLRTITGKGRGANLFTDVPVDGQGDEKDMRLSNQHENANSQIIARSQ